MLVLRAFQLELIALYDIIKVLLWTGMVAVVAARHLFNETASTQTHAEWSTFGYEVDVLYYCSELDEYCTTLQA